MEKFINILRGENIVLEETLNDLGIKTRTLFGNHWLSTKQVLKNISKKWDKLPQETRNKLCDLLLQYSK